jgi:hypothetical protein
MFRATAAFVVACAFATPGLALGADTPRTNAAPAIYFPERNDWQHRKPEDVGMDSARLDLAVKSAIANDTEGRARALMT